MRSPYIQERDIDEEFLGDFVRFDLMWESGASFPENKGHQYCLLPREQSDQMRSSASMPRDECGGISLGLVGSRSPKDRETIRPFS